MRHRRIAAGVFVAALALAAAACNNSSGTPAKGHPANSRSGPAATTATTTHGSGWG